MNSRFILSITTIIGLLMPSLFYAMDPFMCKVPRTEQEKVEVREKHALLEKRQEREHEPRPLRTMQSVTLVPKKESFVIAPDKGINSYCLQQIAMDQGSGQLLAAVLGKGAHNSFIYAINPQKKTWKLIHRSDNAYEIRSVRVCDDTIFICKHDKIIRWSAATKSCEDMLGESPTFFSDFDSEKDAHSKHIAAVGRIDKHGKGEVVVVDVDAQCIIDSEPATSALVPENVAITHLSNGSTLFAKFAGLKIKVKVAGDKKPPLVINRRNQLGYIFLYEDMHKRPTLINYLELAGIIDVYDASTGALCLNNKKLKNDVHFLFRKKNDRTFMAVSHRDAPEVEIFDISDRDAWKLVTTCAVNDAQYYKKSLGMYIDDFGYPHLASITQLYGAACWPLQLWEPKERAHTIAQIKSAIQTHLGPDGIANTILGYAGSTEHAHAIDRYNAQENSLSDEPELAVAPIGADGVSEGRLQPHVGPPPAHPSWFARNEKWLKWVGVGCSVASIVFSVVSIIKSRRR